MRVGVVIGEQKPDAGGGYTFQTDVFENLAQIADASTHRFVVFCSSAWSDRYSNDPKFLALEFAPFQKSSFIEKLFFTLRPNLPWLARYFSIKDSLEGKMLKHGVEVAWMVSAGGKPLDIPYIATVWDLMHLTHPWFPEVSSESAWYQREAVFSDLLRRATVVITGTETGRDEIEMFYRVPRERIKLLPHPTPKFALEEGGTYCEDIRARYGISGDFLLYPAQFWAHKNHIVLLRALAALNRRYGKKFTMVFVGSDKGNLAHVQWIAHELRVADQVRFLGFIPISDLAALYREAFAMTYSSFCGPENLPPLEAFAFGCPVIASDIPGSREQLGDAAILVDPSNAEQFADAVTRLIDDASLKLALIENGLRRAHVWSGKQFVLRVLEILDGFESVRETWGI